MLILTLSSNNPPVVGIHLNEVESYAVKLEIRLIPTEYEVSFDVAINSTLTESLSKTLPKFLIDTWTLTVSPTKGLAGFILIPDGLISKSGKEGNANLKTRSPSNVSNATWLPYAPPPDTCDLAFKIAFPVINS